MDKLRKKFALRITGGFVYKFSDGDLSRLKVLFGETRELLNSSEHFDEAYRTRLAKRIDKLNLRLCKRSTDLDPYWGLVGDAGVIAGKAGKYARLLVDKITQITNIVWRTQARAEELSSSCCPPNLITTMDRKKESK